MDNICPTIWVGSIGDVGSWVFSCATRSCKNKSLLLLANGSADEPVLLEALLLEAAFALGGIASAATGAAAIGLVIAVPRFCCSTSSFI